MTSMKWPKAVLVSALTFLAAAASAAQDRSTPSRCEITSFSASILNVEGAAANQEDMTVRLTYHGDRSCTAIGFPKFDVWPLRKPEAVTDDFPKRQQILVKTGDELNFNVHILGAPAENAPQRSCVKVRSFAIGQFQDLSPSLNEHLSLASRSRPQILLHSPNPVSICLLQVSRVSLAAKQQ